MYKEFDFKKERAAIYTKYNIDLDETTLSFHYMTKDVIKENFASQNIVLETLINKVNDSQKKLEVHHEHPYIQAFFFGFGKFGFAICFASVLLYLFVTNKFETNKENNLNNRRIEWHLKFFNNVQRVDSIFAKKYLYRHPYPAQ